jgi:hypothetical protein
MPKCIFFTICDRDCDGPERNYCSVCRDHWKLELVNKEAKDRCPVCLDDDVELYSHRGICDHGFCLACLITMINCKSFWFDDIRWMATTMIKEKIMSRPGMSDEEAIEELIGLIKTTCRGTNQLLTAKRASPTCSLCKKDLFVPVISQFSKNYIRNLNAGIKTTDKISETLKKRYPDRELITGVPEEQ